VQKCRLFNSGDMEKEQLLKITDGYKAKGIYNADETGLFFRLPPNKTLSLKVDPCNSRNNSKCIPVLTACNAEETNKLPPLVTAKSENLCCFKTSETCPQNM
jgi:hypothetical protein